MQTYGSNCSGIMVTGNSGSWFEEPGCGMFTSAATEQRPNENTDAHLSCSHVLGIWAAQLTGN
jgi:hypothetical protein